MFVHYKQAERLQHMLAKYHCPEMLEKKAIKSNVTGEKLTETKVRIATKPVEDVDLRDWVETKADLLQYALEMRDKERQCQTKTRKMEETMFTCKTEFVRVL